MPTGRHSGWWVWLAIGVASLAACSTEEVLIAHRVPLATTGEPVAEEALLDVGIVVFDPGVPMGELDEKTVESLLEDGVFINVRRAESIQMAVQLRRTLQATGQWGGVWVTPQESSAVDLGVTATIRQSDGLMVHVDVLAKDTMGRVWLDKPYEIETTAGAYNRQRYGDVDPYQDLFNSIANDLSAARARLSADDARAIRTVGTLRYAGELSPHAFGSYVAENDGRYEPRRLPAAGDPMFERTLLVRQREKLFFETLDQHYEGVTAAASESYHSWRESAREESLAIQELTRSARWRAALGWGAMLTSVLTAGSTGGGFMRDAMMMVGSDVLTSRGELLRDRQMHATSLDELSASYDGEVAPMVVEIAGVERRLTGTADAQFAEWRDLLREMFLAEMGAPSESATAEPPTDIPGLGLDTGPEAQ
jgi:hypothetical protein